MLVKCFVSQLNPGRACVRRCLLSFLVDTSTSCSGQYKSHFGHPVVGFSQRGVEKSPAFGALVGYLSTRSFGSPTSYCRNIFIQEQHTGSTDTRSLGRRQIYPGFTAQFVEQLPQYSCAPWFTGWDFVPLATCVFTSSQTRTWLVGHQSTSSHHNGIAVLPSQFMRWSVTRRSGTSGSCRSLAAKHNPTRHISHDKHNKRSQASITTHTV